MSLKIEQAFRHWAIFQDYINKSGIALDIRKLRKDCATGIELLMHALAEELPKAGHPDQYFGALTYAQHGDDLMILNLFRLMGIEKPSYLDLGAHDPYTISNTALLYERGCRGVNVEANPILFEKFKELRPEDVNVNVGVGPVRGTMKFYKYSDTCGRNTFSFKEVQSLRGCLQVQQELDLDVFTLEDIVFAHCRGVFPDLLSCDIEGLDYDVMTTLPSPLETELPKVIVVETRRHDSDKMMKLMVAKDFLPVCRMGENLFFIRSDLSKMVI